MAVFSIQLDNNEMIDYLRDCNYRLQNNNLLENPFRAKICDIKDNTYIIRMLPVYPPAYILGFVSLIPMLLFFGFKWFLIFPLIITLSGVFWSKWFFYFMLRIGLRKKGYNGKIRLLGNNEMMERVLERLKSV